MEENSTFFLGLSLDVLSLSAAGGDGELVGII
jgi:hypothetical protein